MPEGWPCTWCASQSDAGAAERVAAAAVDHLPTSSSKPVPGSMNLLLVIGLVSSPWPWCEAWRNAAGYGWCHVDQAHTLILLLPGLLISYRWKILLDSGQVRQPYWEAPCCWACAGVLESSRLAALFAGPLIQTGPTMMTAGVGTQFGADPADGSPGSSSRRNDPDHGVVLVLWLSRPGGSPTRWVLLILATFAAPAR